MKHMWKLIVSALVLLLAALLLASCNKERPSDALAYMQTEDGAGYQLIGIGSCEDTQIVIPAKYKGKPVVAISVSAFTNLTTITSVTIPPSVTSIESSAFSGCVGLSSITFSPSVRNIGAHAFSNCTSLTSITLPPSVTSIGEDAFYGCTNIETATIPTIAISAMPKGNLKTVVINGGESIDSSAFSGCKNLVSITIPSTVTSIGEYAFYNCTSLVSITIPSSMTSIGYDAFYGCTSLTIYCRAASKPSGWDYSWNSSRPVVWNYKG